MADSVGDDSDGDAVADGSSADAVDDESSPDAERAGGRTVPVPVDVYKRVTVFSTLVATLFVVLGFTMFDAASFETSPVRRVVAALLGALGLAPAGDTVTVGFVLLGLGFIAFGAGVYVLGARFRARETVDGPDGKG